ncbi:MAG: hypothetical protein A2X94_08700 [Bdellovibrionales bacterium GWB1_55_8]|nr:MAG: hypothetical protein A2X94_08700 [Bdellovibrionales bacterium GWB1_55_8]
MSLFTIILIALGLSMDAFAVAVADGAMMGRLALRPALRIAFFFGAFQALMPVLGWFAGLTLRDWIMDFDHWIAFCLLALIGGKMIYESFKLESGKSDSGKSECCAENVVLLLGLSVATSIDALAVGLSFSFLQVSIPMPALIIGVVTFFVSFAGVYLGTKVGHFFEKKISLIGGLVLIGIGAKILIEHLSA